MKPENFERIKAACPGMFDAMDVWPVPTCGDGWTGLIIEAGRAAQALDPAIKARQVKEKWGLLVIYTNSNNRDIWDALGRIEGLSGAVCEDCGEPGERKPMGNWLGTLCEPCGANRR